ncbi:hypothetical protein VKT23_009213 [Stygiomarasmius scandens]|uniref:Uncharacterized protein n=1 Tax=Marasmiellus scandens TaxID=2682957 RepID=A0ABR1JFR8_9AGAR
MGHSRMRMRLPTHQDFVNIYSRASCNSFHQDSLRREEMRWRIRAGQVTATHPSRRTANISTAGMPRKVALSGNASASR